MHYLWNSDVRTRCFMNVDIDTLYLNVIIIIMFIQCSMLTLITNNYSLTGSKCTPQHTAHKQPLLLGCMVQVSFRGLVICLHFHRHNIA